MPLIKYRILENSISHELPSYEKNKLFEFLSKNYHNNRFADSIELAYANLYKEIKLQLSGQETKNIKKKEDKKLLTSRFEKTLYAVLRKIKAPEYLAENIICNIKKSLIYFK